MMKSYGHENISWAMAGRSREKLESIRDSLAKQYKVSKLPDILVGDITNPASLDTIASSTDVIVSTAGPFALYGTPLVDAAVQNSTDYLDITGETPWICSMAHKYHAIAKEKGVRIIHCCGYDSVPSDMGAWVVMQKAKELGKRIKSIQSVNVDGKGGVSGGTIASGMNMAADPELRKADISMYSYIPDPTEARGNDTDVWTPQWCQPLNRWLAPFIMQAVNTRVVQRSNYLLDWGKDKFSYSEMIGVKNRLQAWLVSLFTGLGVLVFSQPWLHGLLKKIVPAPGQGPSREQMMSGYYKHIVIGEADDGTVIYGTFADPSRDPGYWGTSRLLLESALCLALEKDALNASSDVLHGGVLTPASALGPVLQKRLEQAGIMCHTVDTI